jgi:hypothetical protein
VKGVDTACAAVSDPARASREGRRFLRAPGKEGADREGEREEAGRR